MTAFSAVLALSGLATACATAVVAGRWWLDRSALVDLPRGTAEDEGVDAAALEALAGRMMERRSEAFIVARHGRVVLERYAPSAGFRPVPDRARRRSIASMGKALVGGTVLAIGVCEGWLDPDRPASDHLAAWREDPRKRAVTLRDLATHTSGLAGASGNPSTKNPEPVWTGGVWAKLERRAEVALTRAPLVAERGAEVRYSNPGYTVYSVALAKAAQAAGRGHDVEALLQERVLGPLGIPERASLLSYGRMFEAEGTRYRETGSGGRLTPRAVVRLAELVAGGGVWNGRRILERRCPRRGAQAEPRG
jgi:CubicO group peptidase (beta-lactamase class C family)